jgi:para-nitrobenzyl esterase
LNIYKPASADSFSNLPVWLFMHGGSFVYGSSSFPLYEASHVANTNNVIVVTINYRLGNLGFLAGDLLKAESSDGSVGNYGHQDQRMAMKWVSENIKTFGGDPTRIMLFGESAGGGSTSGHLTNPRSWPYIHSAIIESGSWADWTAQPWSIAQQRLPLLASNLGCSTAADVLACMRAIDYKTVRTADNTLLPKGPFLEWGPVIDGVEILDDPRNLLIAGKVAPVPIMLGWNADEGTVFNDAPANITAADYPAAVAGIVGQDLAPEILAQYPLTNYKTPWWALTALLSDSQMVCPAEKSARRLVNATARPVNPGVFVYYYTHVFDIIKIIEQFTKKPLGCFHGSELALVFNPFPEALFGSGEEKLAQLVGRYWARFAATGNPNGGLDPTWPEFGASNGKFVMLDTDPYLFTYNVTVSDSYETEMCAWWRNYSIPATTLWG